MPRILLILAVLFPLTALATTIEVCPSCPVSSITEAIAQAKAGDEVLVMPGTYREGNILIDKSIFLTGVDRPVVDGEGLHEIFTIRAPGVAIEGFRLVNAGKSTLKDFAAIRVDRQRQFVICDNEIENAQFGIYIAYGRKGIVENNRLISDAVDEVNSGNGIHCWSAKEVFIAHNYVARHRDGIYLEFTDDSQIVNNHSEYNLRYGLHFMFSNNDLYSQNLFTKNGAGVAVMYSKKIDMFDNRFEQNWGRSSYGLLLKDISDGQMRGNIFLSNTIGIVMESASRIDYTKNIFKSNGWAVQVSGGCMENHFTENAFLSNTQDLVVGSKGFDNTFDGNYWSEHNGYDLDRDGFGDVPYRPVKLFSFIVSQTPETMILLRSFFIDLLNFSEKVSPSLTPANVQDHRPLMKQPEF
jgi:nitrous oxidase accessory protein